MFDGNWIKQNLNVSDNELRALFNKALNWLAKKSGDSREDILSALKEDAPFVSLGYLPRSFQRPSIQYMSLLLSYCGSEFNKTHYHITPETLEWGGFMSHDIFTTTDTKGLESFANWLTA
jgi:hypothetical protein